jgi:Uma2 family endonuclease
MPATVTMTAAQFDALPYEEGRRWELLEGDLIEVPSPTLDHQEIVFRILLELKQHLGTGQGIASHDVEFALAEDTRVRPDVWVVLGERAAKLDRSRVPIPGCPDLAIEVISPSEHTAESMAKVDSYFRAGALEVWQVYPKPQQVFVYVSAREIRKLSAGDSISTALLPGFELQVAAIFAR